MCTRPDVLEAGRGALWGLYWGTNPIYEGSTLMTWSPSKGPTNTIILEIKFNTWTLAGHSLGGKKGLSHKNLFNFYNEICVLY